MRKIILGLGSLVMLNGIYILIATNFNLGVFLTNVLGIFLLLWGSFYTKIKKYTVKGFFKWLKIIVCIMICFELCIVGFLVVFGFFDNVDYSEDAVLVLGAGIRGDMVSYPLRTRLDKAVEYHKKNPDAYIVVSGGQGAQETVTEAYAMKKYLLSKQVLEDRIIEEDKSTSTDENMSFSKKILDNVLTDDYKLVVITNDFHTYRASVIAEKSGFSDVSHIGSQIQICNIIPCYIRESLAVLKMWVFD